MDRGESKRQRTMAILQRTKDALDSIKHPGQTYDGIIQELVELWKKEHREDSGVRSRK